MTKELKRFIKIQQEMLKALTNSPSVSIWGEFDDETIAVSWDGFRLHLIPKEHYYLDLHNKCESVKVIDSMFKELENSKRAKEIHLLKKYGKTLVKIESEDGVCAYYDESLMKYFPKEYTLYVVSPIKPIFVKQCNNLLGLILPTRVE